MFDVSTNSAGLIVLGAMLLVARRLIYPARSAAMRDWGHLALGLGAWAFIVVGGLGVFQVLCGLELGLILWVVVLSVASMIAQRRRAAERNALLWVLTIAAEKQMPLAPGV